MAYLQCCDNDLICISCSGFKVSQQSVQAIQSKQDLCCSHLWFLVWQWVIPIKWKQVSNLVHVEHPPPIKKITHPPQIKKPKQKKQKKKEFG